MRQLYESKTEFRVVTISSLNKNRHTCRNTVRLLCICFDRSDDIISTVWVRSWIFVKNVHEFQNILGFYLAVFKGALCRFGGGNVHQRKKTIFDGWTELTDSLFYFSSYLQEPSLPPRSLQTLFQRTYSHLRTACFIGVSYTGDHGDMSRLVF